ncbi:MAG TPA: hypothetical protein PK742_10590 [Chitinophagales bacterium]|nr:hypothetical protein [Chitinophagales bacterium]
MKKYLSALLLAGVAILVVEQSSAATDIGPPGIHECHDIVVIDLQKEAMAVSPLYLSETGVAVVLRSTDFIVPIPVAVLPVAKTAEDPISWRLSSYENSYGENQGYRPTDRTRFSRDNC